MTPRRTARAAALTLSLLLVTGCSPGIDTADEAPAPVATAPAPPVESPDDQTPEATEVPEPQVTFAATTLVPELSVHESPDGPVSHTFGLTTELGAPTTFMTVGQEEGWVEVQVPARPNGTTGWVSVDDVRLAEVPYSIEVSTTENTLSLLRHGLLMDTFAVATGTGETPTPLGTYYLTELVAPTNTGYGPFAYGISAYSDVLNEFLGGPGQIGLHGTDDAASIGQAASHGCIRMSNEDITRLAQLLPLGTPIVIT